MNPFAQNNAMINKQPMYLTFAVSTVEMDAKHFLAVNHYIAANAPPPGSISNLDKLGGLHFFQQIQRDFH
jgi:hypothetical protein